MFQNKKLHLTYSTHLDCEKWLKWMNEVRKCIVEKYSWVHEVGKTGYPHTHILVELQHPLITRDVRYLDYESIHPNITRITKKQHYDYIVNVYHRKEPGAVRETNIQDFLEKIENKRSDTTEKKTKKETIKDPAPGVEEIWQEDSASAAIDKYAKGPGGIYKVSSIVSTYKLKPISYGPEPEVDWLPWQEELDTEIRNGYINDRSVIWYVDEHGCGGKTCFAKHYGMYRGAFVATNCNIYHLATQLAEMFCKGNPISTVIINIARTDEIPNSIYTGLEQLKDGMVTSQKYVGRTMYFNSPNVIVFSNQEPKKRIDYNVRKKVYNELIGKEIFETVIESRLTLSEDKWDIRYIDNETASVFKREYTPKPKRVLQQGKHVPGTILSVGIPEDDPELEQPDGSIVEDLDESVSMIGFKKIRE